MSTPVFDHSFNSFEVQAVIRALDGGRTSNVFIWDIRDAFERSSWKPLPHAVLVPMGELKMALDMRSSAFETKYRSRKPNTKDKILIYCATQARSGVAVGYLKSRGYVNVVAMQDSLPDYYANTQNNLDEDL